MMDGPRRRPGRCERSALSAVATMPILSGSRCPMPRNGGADPGRRDTGVKVDNDAEQDPAFVSSTTKRENRRPRVSWSVGGG